MKKVLLVVAHPDDEVLGCGALIRKIICESGNVKLIILGEGSSCRFSLDLIESKEVKQAIEQRRSFANQALGVLGVKDVFFLEIYLAVVLTVSRSLILVN